MAQYSFPSRRISSLCDYAICKRIAGWTLELNRVVPFLRAENNIELFICHNHLNQLGPLGIDAKPIPWLTIIQDMKGNRVYMFECQRPKCHAVWQPRLDPLEGDLPVRCPQCLSPYWQSSSVVKVPKKYKKNVGGVAELQ